MKRIFYAISLICAIGCAANIWCIVTHQPSSLHLNGFAAVLSGVAAVLIFAIAREVV